MTSKSPRRSPTDHEYLAGDIYSFRTSPLTEFSPKETGRYAALKIIGRKDGIIYYVVLDGTFDGHPEFAEACGLPWLMNSRFAAQGEPALNGTPEDWENDLADLRYVGTVELSPADVQLLPGFEQYGTWLGASSDAEGEWRWRNDRAACVEEVAYRDRVRDEKMAADLARYETRLKGLTWEKLLAEKPFPRWDEHPPFPHPDFVTLARDKIRSTVLELQALGQRPKKAQVRAALRACVEWFNATDLEYGEAIYTEEREDICLALEELAVVAKHRSLFDDIHAWRTW